MNTTRFFSSLLILLIAACGFDVKEIDVPPTPKTSVDLAMGCLEDLRSCEEWEPKKIEGPALKKCPKCDGISMPALKLVECEKRMWKCQDYNLEAQLKQGNFHMSPCQQKAQACVDLVLATQGKTNQ